MKMKPCDQVDMTYFSTAPYVFTASIQVKASPQSVFDIFEDADSWPAWAMPIQKVEWTSPRPFGVGTTRRVSMTGGLDADEVFIAWDASKRMAFCFTHCSQQLIASFAEDYQVTDLGSAGTEIKWTMAITPTGVGRISLFLSKPLMHFGVKWLLGGLKKYIDARA